MRKNLFYFVLAAVSLIIALPSCSKDNGDGNDVDYAAQIAKSYPGTLIVAGTSTEYTMDVSRRGVNLIKLELTNFTYMGMNFGDIVLDSITLKKTGNDSIRFSAENKSVTVNVNGDPTTVMIDVEGASLNSTLTVEMLVKYIMPIPVYFTTEPVTGNAVAEGGEIWTAMNGIYDGILNPGDIDKNVTVEKTGGYDIMITIPSVSFAPGMPNMTISVPATVTENPDETCSFSGTIPYVGGTLTGTAMSVGNITFTASALGYTIEYTGSK